MNRVKFDPRKWQTEYDVFRRNQIPPSLPGIYAFVRMSFEASDLRSELIEEVMYIGMSKRLNRRIYGHKMLRHLQEKYGELSIIIYYQVHHSNLRELEAKAIRKLDPIYNLIHRDPLRLNGPKEREVAL